MESEVIIPQACQEGTGCLADVLAATGLPKPRLRMKCENTQTHAAVRTVKANTDGSQNTDCCVMIVSFDKDWGVGKTHRVGPQIA